MARPRSRGDYGVEVVDVDCVCVAGATDTVGTFTAAPFAGVALLMTTRPSEFTRRTFPFVFAVVARVVLVTGATALISFDRTDAVVVFVVPAAEPATGVAIVLLIVEGAETSPVPTTVLLPEEMFVRAAVPLVRPVDVFVAAVVDVFVVEGEMIAAFVPGVVLVATAAFVAAVVPTAGATVPAAVRPVPVDGTAMTAVPPLPPPAGSAGVGSELIDELTVICGFATADGDWNWPVTCCMLAPFVSASGDAGPSTLPRKPSFAFITATASTVASTAAETIGGGIVAAVPVVIAGVVTDPVGLSMVG